MRMRPFLRAVIFALAAALLLSRVSVVLKNKDETRTATLYTVASMPAQSADVLIAGASSVWKGVSPTALYETYGISALSVCASGQPAMGVYYVLLDALRR